MLHDDVPLSQLSKLTEVAEEVWVTRDGLPVDLQLSKLVAVFVRGTYVLLDATAKAKSQVKSRFFVDAVMVKRASIFQQLA